MCSWGFDEYYSIYMLLLKINESLNFMKNQSNVLDIIRSMLLVSSKTVVYPVLNQLAQPRASSMHALKAPVLTLSSLDAIETVDCMVLGNMV